jgi:type IV secretory pathway VirB10-like protein
MNSNTNTSVTMNTNKGMNMASNPLVRRIGIAVGGGAIIAMIGLSAACSTSSDEPEEPTTTTTTTTTTTEPSLNPTEKAPDPNNPGVFTPPVKAPQPTVDRDRDNYGH